MSKKHGQKGVKTIDYRQDGKTILWECLRAATYTILGRSHIQVSHEDYYDISMDIMSMAHDKCMRELSKWDKSFPLFNFVYYRVWSVSGNVIRRYIDRLYVETTNVSLDDPYPNGDGDTYKDSLPTEAKPVYTRKQTSKDKRRTRPYHTYGGIYQRDLQDDYLDYVGACEEYGITAVDFQTFKTKTEAL